MLLGIQEWQKCQECGDPLPRLARRVFKANMGLCPRCHMILAEWEINLDKVEHRDMRLRGSSSIVVPRVELHTPTTAPGNAVPVI